MNSILIVRLLRLSFPIFIIGVLFKLMHWPGSQLLITVCVAMVLLLYPIRFYLKKEKRFIDYIKLLLLLTFPADYYLRVFHLPSNYLLTIISFSLFVIWIILELFDTYNNTDRKKEFKVFPFGILSIIIFTLIVAVFYKIIHLEEADSFLIFGFSLLAIYFLIDTFKPKS